MFAAKPQRHHLVKSTPYQRYCASRQSKVVVHYRMLQFGQNDGPGPKCYFTSSTLPAFVDRQQIPKKKRPFSMIAEGKSVHTVGLGRSTGF